MTIQMKYTFTTFYALLLLNVQINICDFLKTKEQLYSFTSLLEEAAKKDYPESWLSRKKKVFNCVLFTYSCQLEKFAISDLLHFELQTNIFLFFYFKQKKSQQYMVPFLKNSFLEANAIDECVTDG